MTSKEREDARERCKRATAGPWEKNGPFVVGPKMQLVADFQVTGNTADKDFIIHARTDLPAALKQIDDDEGLMGQALKVLNDCACRTHWLDALEDMRLLLRARLGEVPTQGEEADDGEAKR